MSFDVFLQHFVGGEVASAERTGILRALQARRYTGPDQFGFYLVSFPDGVDVEFSADGLESEGEFSGCAFHVRGWSEELAKFIFEVAHAGRMAVFATMAEPVVIVASEDVVPELPPEVTGENAIAVVGESADLGSILTGGYESWSRYRAQVTGKRLNKGEGGPTTG